MPHAPVTRPAPRRSPRHPHPRHSTPRPVEDVVRELRMVIAAAYRLDPAALGAQPADPVEVPGCLHLLGAGSSAPLRTAGDALDRVDELARALVDRMREHGWAEDAAPVAVTSVLAASVPAAERVLLLAARSRRR